MKRFFFVFLFALTALFFTACSSSDDDNGGGGGGNGIGVEAGEFPNPADITGFPGGYSSTVIYKTYRAANTGAAFTDYIDAWEKNVGWTCDRSDPTGIDCSGTDTVESVNYNFGASLFEYSGIPLIGVSIENPNTSTTTPDESLYDSLPPVGGSLVYYGYDYRINFANPTALTDYQGALVDELKKKGFTEDTDPEYYEILYIKKSGNKTLEVGFNVSDTITGNRTSLYIEAGATANFL
jgi:hypothetical protein